MEEQINVRDLSVTIIPLMTETILSWKARPRQLTNCGESCRSCEKAERANNGVLDMETKVVTGLTAYGPGYIAEDLKDLEKVVGLQTDKPLKRAFMPYGGIKMAEQACEMYGYKVDPQIQRYVYKI